MWLPPSTSTVLPEVGPNLPAQEECLREDVACCREKAEDHAGEPSQSLLDNLAVGTID